MDEAEVKKRQDFLRELYLAGYDKANGFMALVISAGYAGGFTAWDRVQRYITYPERMLTACFFLSSLAIFVGWQIRGQWVLSQQQLRISEMISAPVADFDALREKFRVEQVALRAGLQRQLPWVFGITVSLGGLGCAVLLVACARHFWIGRP